MFVNVKCLYYFFLPYVISIHQDLLRFSFVLVGATKQMNTILLAEIIIPLSEHKHYPSLRDMGVVFPYLT